MLRELEARGVEALDCFSVDNALVRPCDPLFVGYCADRQSDCGEFLAGTQVDSSTSFTQPCANALPAYA